MLMSHVDPFTDATTPSSTGHRDNRYSFDAGHTMLQLIAENALDLLSVQSARGEFVYTSPNVRELFGWTPSELRGVSIFALVHPDDADPLATTLASHAKRKEVRVRYRLKCRDGQFRWVESRSRKSLDGVYVVAMTRDIEAEVAQLHRLEQLATHDALTNLPNRRGLEAALISELDRCSRHDTSLSIVFFDIDSFKQLNDSHGHDYGDRILVQVGECVDKAKRSFDVLGRWGGDEFLLLLPDTRCDVAMHVAQRIKAAAALEIPSITLSFGVSCTQEDDSIQALLARADEALYRGKRLGGDRVIASQTALVEDR